MPIISVSRLCVFVCVLVTQSCLTLYNPMDCSLPGSSAHGFPRQEYLSGLPFPSPRDLSDPGIAIASPAWQADSVSLSHLVSPRWNYTMMRTIKHFSKIWFYNYNKC